MGFLEDNCTLMVLDRDVLSKSKAFSCGNDDLDDFFMHESIDYAMQLLGKTYCYVLNEDPTQIVAAFTLSNASIRVDDLPNARKKKIEKDIPHVKSFKDYPATLLGRLGVNQEFQSKHIGSDLMNFIKYWFVDSHNKTGCRFLIVDSYNTFETLAFYQANGFQPVFSTDEQEKKYRRVAEDQPLKTRLLYFDLISLCMKNA